MKSLLRWFDSWRFGSIDPRAPLGKRGEQAAERYLRKRGYRIISRNDRSGIGELDLVAVDGRTVVFVEVKTRAGDRHGHPADRVDQAKQHRLTQIALSYLKSHDLLEHRARMDVIAVWWPDGATEPDRIEHFQNAFEATGQYQWFS